MLVASSVSVAPTLRVVNVAEVKAQARIDSGHEDTVIEGIIAAAERLVEERCRRCFRPQTLVSYYTDVKLGTPEVLQRAPVTSATIYYRDTASTWTAVTATKLIEGESALWYPPSGVTPHCMEDGSPNWKAVTVCGHDIPPPIKQAILMLSAHLYEQRTPVLIGASIADIPFTIDALLAPFTIPAV